MGWGGVEVVLAKAAWVGADWEVDLEAEGREDARAPDTDTKTQ